MLLALTILLFVLIFGAIIVIHEAGHFFVARWEGMRVKEFAFGFPPRIKSIKRGGTQFSFNAVPLGGYVSILGEEEESDAADSFGKKSPWARLRVVLAGITMNFLLAWVLLTVYFWVAPFGPKVDAIAIASVRSGSAAEQAGIKVNDFIVAANGEALESESDLSEFTKAHAGQTVSFDVRRNGGTETISVTLGTDAAAPLGVAIADVGEAPVVPWYLAPWYALQEIWFTVVATLTFIGSFVAKLFGGGQGVSVDAVSGPVGIFAMLQQILMLGVPAVIRFSALISLAVGIFNLLPFPALDGGRAAFLLVEGFFGKRAISHRSEALIHALGFVLLILLILVVTYYDIRKLS
ncbi:site-2 protease family protein [Candidatus Berkelbacteria bacterium]|nr:site-2 protease family protein [Candidatus Berkelbacteria bacterium]